MQPRLAPTGRRHITQLRRAVADASHAAGETTTALILASTAEEPDAWQAQYDALARRDELTRQLRAAEFAASRRGQRTRRRVPAGA